MRELCRVKARGLACGSKSEERDARGKLIRIFFFFKKKKQPTPLSISC